MKAWDEQETQPLPIFTGNQFQAVLDRYQLSWFAVAQAARVPVAPVWRIARGLPITPEHEQLVRHGLRRLTGVPYTGRIAVFEHVAR